MSTNKNNEIAFQPLKEIFSKALMVILPSLLLVPLSLIIPQLNPDVLPNIDLTSGTAIIAYYITEIGGGVGTPFVIIVILLAFSVKRGMTTKQGIREMSIIIMVLAIVIGGCSYFNEKVLKPKLNKPRPSIVALERAGVLGMTAAEFYKKERSARSDYLKVVIPPGFHTIKLDDRIRKHWIHAVGFNLPSGHAMGAFALSTFFIAMAIMFFPASQAWWFYILSPWALLICYSRTILRVHGSFDICMGALEGVFVGLISFVIAYLLIARTAAKQQGA